MTDSTLVNRTLEKQTLFLFEQHFIHLQYYKIINLYISALLYHREHNPMVIFKHEEQQLAAIMEHSAVCGALGKSTNIAGNNCYVKLTAVKRFKQCLHLLDLTFLTFDSL